MRIDDLDIVGVAVVPGETDAPLIVNPNPPRSRPITRKRLQAVAWRYAQIFQPFRRVEKEKLSAGNAFNVLETAHGTVEKQRFCGRAMEKPEGQVITEVVFR